MHRGLLWRIGQSVLLVAVVFCAVSTSTAYATDARSNNFQVTETEFGSTSGLEGCSSSLCSRASFGSSTNPEGSSTTHQAVFDDIAADSDPLLEVMIVPGESDLGELTTEKTSTKTTIIAVRTHLTDGYTLHIQGDAPRFDGHSLHTTSTPTASTPGVEFFGINVVENTDPVLGKDPEQVPSTDTSFGEPVAGYNMANLFKYGNGDVIARSDVDSGLTRYTISMVVNVSNQTPAGRFTSDFSAVVIPSF